MTEQCNDQRLNATTSKRDVKNVLTAQRLNKTTFQRRHILDVLKRDNKFERNNTFVFHLAKVESVLQYDN